jgi:predicted Ser/Thr protein kinase
MKTVLKGEEVKKYVRIDGDIVTRHHVTEHKILDHVELTWVFDFKGVPHSQIIELASRAVLIGSRPRFKKTSVKDAESWDDKTFNVLDFLARERAKLTPRERAARALAACTPETRRELAEEEMEE